MYDEAKRLYAISDGATDSAFQKRWAELLVKGFISEPPELCSPSLRDCSLGDWLEALQCKWVESIEWGKLPFHGYNKARLTGGLATFLGIQFASNNEWRGISVGDCNLFQLRSGELCGSWTIVSSSEFGNSPIALSSINHNYQALLENVAWITGYYAPGDMFLMTTDALAEYFLKWRERDSGFNKKITSFLNRIWRPNVGQLKFVKRINSARRRKSMRNDDVTLLVIRVDETREQ